MTKLQILNVFLTERLMLAAQEIYKAVEDTILEYQEEIIRGKRENDQLRFKLREAGIETWPERPLYDCEEEGEGSTGQKVEPEVVQSVEKESCARKGGRPHRDHQSHSTSSPQGNADYALQPASHPILSPSPGESGEGDSLGSSAYKQVKTEADGLSSTAAPGGILSSLNLDCASAQSENSDCETTDDFWCYAVWRRGEEEVEGVVPSTWIVGQKVLWPPTNGRQAVKERHKPGPKWTTHNLIKIKLFSESLATCERYCSTSSEEVTENSESDYEPSPQRKRRRRKKKTGQDNGTGPDQVHKEQSEDDTRTSRDESGSGSPPPPKKKRTVTNDRPGEPEAESSAAELEPHLDAPELRGLDDSHHEDNIRIVGAHSSNTWEDTFTPPQPPDGGLDFPLPTGEFQEQVLGLLLDIQNTLRNLGGRVEALEHNVTHFEVCRTFDDLAALEHSMASPEAAAQMKQYLSRIGGNSLRSNVGKVMERLMTNELMSHFNVKGSKGRKRSFDSSPLKKIIIDSVMIAHPHATETAISQMIANALKQAPDRRGGVGRCRQPIVIKHEII